MKADEENHDFTGAKIALISHGAVVTYRRDNKPGIPFPNLWDLAGGGREGNETPEQCVLRETKEEFGLVLDESRIVWRCQYPNSGKPREWAYFMVAEITQSEVEAICFGEEGQYWQLMDCYEFLRHPDAVPQLRERLGHFLRHR